MGEGGSAPAVMPGRRHYTVVIMIIVVGGI